MDNNAVRNAIDILKQNNININTKISTYCEYGHRYTISLNDFDKCPLCEKYTQEHIKDIIITRRKNQSVRIDIGNDDKITPSSVYIVNLQNDITNESFYKIGYSTKSVFDRLNDIPYIITKHKVIFTNLAYAKFIERHLHILHDDYVYQPKIGFDGCSECFTEIIIDTQDIFDNINVNKSKFMADIIAKYLLY